MSFAQVCEVDNVKQSLRKILYLYFTDPNSMPLTQNEVKDMLTFYLSIKSQNLTVDCSVLGENSNKPIFDVMSQSENIPDAIPACGDGTKYGECSKFRPAYCYAGVLYSKCDLCGCPTNSVCGKSKKCEPLAQNVTCFTNIDCGQNTFTGNYYCANNYITRNYVNYTCINPGTTDSKCISSNGTISLTYCNPSLNQVCVNGVNTCQTTINDSAPTVAIVAYPKTVASGQLFNVTVTGTDDAGLAAIWWWGVNSADTEMNKAHWYSCNGAKFCTYSWLASTNATGTLTLGANSRDTSYPIAGQPHQASEGAGIAYDTITVTSAISNATTFDTITVKGRFVDRFSNKPLANIPLQLLKSGYQNIGIFYANANGEFAITTGTIDITQSSNKVISYTLVYAPNCYMSDNLISISRYPTSGYLTDFPNYQANAIYVWANPFDLSKTGNYFAVIGLEVNIGDVPLWPSADISINSDVPIGFNIEYPEEGRSTGNSGYVYTPYLRSVVPLNYNVRVKVFDNAGNTYYSPYTTVPLSNGCTPVNLNFLNKQFSWNTTTLVANATNQSTMLPDLIVSDITFAPTNPTTNDVIYANVIVKNIGTATASSSSVLRIDYGNYYTRLVVNSLASGSSQTLQVSASYSAGTYEYRATADVDATISESNETNNMLSKNITVTQYISTNQTNGTYNQTSNLTTTNNQTLTTFSCTGGVTKTVDFEDDPYVGGDITWNPDYGATPSDVTAHRSWLNTKGIDINGTPNGFVWSTGISGYYKTGVIIGFASPNFLEDHSGLSDNEVLTINFVQAPVKAVQARATIANSGTSTVVMDAYDAANNLITSTTKTYTEGGSVYAPWTIDITAPNIAKITLRATQYPLYPSSTGVWLEDISFCT